MSRLLCLTELLRRLTGHQRAAARRLGAPGAHLAYREVPPVRFLASTARAPLTCSQTAAYFIYAANRLRIPDQRGGPGVADSGPRVPIDAPQEQVFRALADPGRRRL